MRNGFHEDGLMSAMAVAERLDARAPWLPAMPVDPTTLSAATG
jgi:predicted NAD/FAD-binding protein